MAPPRKNATFFNIREYSRYFRIRVKQHNSHVSSAFYKHSISNNHPQANTSNFKMIDQDSKQVTREAREVIYIKISNATLNYNTGKMYMPEIFNHLLGKDRSFSESNQVVNSDLPQGHTHPIIPSNRFSRAVCLVN